MRETWKDILLYETRLREFKELGTEQEKVKYRAMENARKFKKYETQLSVMYHWINGIQKDSGRQNFLAEMSVILRARWIE